MKHRVHCTGVWPYTADLKSSAP